MSTTVITTPPDLRQFAAYAEAVTAYRVAQGLTVYPVRYMRAEHRSAYVGAGAR